MNNYQPIPNWPLPGLDLVTNNLNNEYPYPYRIPFFNHFPHLSDSCCYFSSKDQPKATANDQAKPENKKGEERTQEIGA